MNSGVTMSEKWRVGQIIDGQYEVLDIKGGGMGVVFICFDRTRGSQVALKTFRDRFLFDERVVRRFSDEAAIWIRLGSHPNIVRAFAVVNIDFRPYIVLEQVATDGLVAPDLAGCIPPGGMDIGRTVDYAMQFCEGMIHARKAASDEEHEFVHADIKPSNIFIQPRGGEEDILKISDFGLSRSYDDSELLENWGSLAFMPPERFDGGAMDVRSDIYSFGCVLYEMIVGARPFVPESQSNQSSEREAYRRMHERARPLRPGAARPDCPEALEAIVMECLAKEASDRIPDFSALRDRLAALPCREGRAWDRPASASPRDSDEAVSELERAVALVNIGKFREALPRFEAILADDADEDARYIALCGRGSALEGLGLAEEAAAAFDSAIEMFPGRAHAYVMRANIDNNAGRPEDALRLYDAALAIDRDYTVGLYDRGLCYERLGRLEESLDDFGRAIELGMSEALTNRGGVYRKLGLSAEALRDFEAAIAQNPRNAIALSNAGSLYEDSGQLDQAEAMYALAVKINPDYLIPRFFRAELLAREGRFREAVADFENALAIDTTRTRTESELKYSITQDELDRIYPTIFHDCAVACLNAGDKAKARAYLRRFAEVAAPLYEKELGPALRVLDALERELGN
jgi:tetratricopeptide (TPR) repeat protein